MKKILLLTDNELLLNRFVQLLRKKKLDVNPGYKFDYAYSSFNKQFAIKYANNPWIRPLRIKEEVERLVHEYNLIFSLHCKQLFPAELVRQVKCINIHPGLNPFNRGWFPQVFSIIKSLPAGATIHEIDEQLDHGPVICQQEVKIEMWDTSLTAYNKILDAETELLDKHLPDILEDNYITFRTSEGNLNLKSDFDALCKIDIIKRDTIRNHINILRALTHGTYENAYLADEQGQKVFLNLDLKKK
jgi:dTDP-4-amino-4,6-dideoxyglucose formyltransferase